MNYKFNLTQKDFEELLKKQDKKSQSDDLKNELEYYLNRMRALNGKSVEDLANERYGDQKMQEDGSTNDDLYQKAKEYTDAIRAEKASDLTENSQKKKSTLESTKEKLKTDQQVEEQEITDEYEQKQKTAQNKAVKNGIARSSIIANLIKAHGAEKQKHLSNSSAKYQNELSEVNSQITELETALKNALNALDMTTAVQLNERLEKLKSQRDNYNQKVAEHNAKIQEKISDYKQLLLSGKEQKEDVDYLKNKGGSLAVSAVKALYNYLDSLPIEQAFKELENPEYAKLFTKEAIQTAKSYLQDRLKQENKKSS